MTAASHSLPFATSIEQLHNAFLPLLARIQLHAEVSFRHVRCRNHRAECCAEVVALCWKWFVRLAERGKDARRFASILATFAVRAVRSGRRACGQEKAGDVLSPRAQQRRGFTVTALPDASQPENADFIEALHDNTVTPVPDQVEFRLDFPSWRASRSERDRRVIGALMIGEQTKHVSRRFGMSPGRVSQLRREFHDDWMMFCGEQPDDKGSSWKRTAADACVAC